MKQIPRMLLSCVASALLNSPAVAQPAAFQLSDRNTCAEVRLDRTSGFFQNLPPADQTDTALCYAFVATSLFDSATHDHRNPPNYSSPIAAAFAYGALRGLTSLVNLPVTEVIPNLSNLRRCPESVVRSRVSSGSIGDFLWSLERLHKDVRLDRRAKADAITTLISKSAWLSPDAMRKLNVYGALYPDRTYVGFVNELLSQACADSSEPFAAVSKFNVLRSSRFSSLQASMEAMRRRIHEELGRKSALPVGISYCQRALTDPKVQAVTESGKYSYDSCEGAAHTSLVIGRRVLDYTYTEGGKMKSDFICQYLVRDSFGPDCKGGERDPSTPGATRCENGAYWVDEDRLLRNTGEVFWYQNSGREPTR